jgi:hypothetical protein
LEIQAVGVGRGGVIALVEDPGQFGLVAEQMSASLLMV